MLALLEINRPHLPINK